MLKRTELCSSFIMMCSSESGVGGQQVSRSNGITTFVPSTNDTVCPLACICTCLSPSGFQITWHESVHTCARLLCQADCLFVMDTVSSAWMFAGSQCVWVTLSTSLESRLNTGPVWSLRSHRTGSWRHPVPVSSSDMFEEKQTPEWEDMGFLSPWRQTETLVHICRSDKYRQKQKQKGRKRDHITKGGDTGYYKTRRLWNIPFLLLKGHDTPLPVHIHTSVVRCRCWPKKQMNNMYVNYNIHEFLKVCWYNIIYKILIYIKIII